MNEDKHQDPLETRLGKLRLARPSNDFIGRGQTLIRSARPATVGWRSWLLPSLSLALVLSVTANVLQLVRTHRLENQQTERIAAECQTPAAVYFPDALQPGIEVADYPQTPQPLGRC